MPITAIRRGGVSIAGALDRKFFYSPGSGSMRIISQMFGPDCSARTSCTTASAMRRPLVPSLMFCRFYAVTGRLQNSAWGKVTIVASGSQRLVSSGASTMYQRSRAAVTCNRNRIVPEVIIVQEPTVVQRMTGHHGLHYRQGEFIFGLKGHLRRDAGLGPSPGKGGLFRAVGALAQLTEVLGLRLHQVLPFFVKSLPSTMSRPSVSSRSTATSCQCRRKIAASSQVLSVTRFLCILMDDQSMSDVFLFYDGIQELATHLTGNETLHVGIRPFGCHAGNKLPLIVYPWILCDIMRQKGYEPCFRVVVSVNDWEPHKLRYLDENIYPYNVFPEITSFQYTPDENLCCTSIVEHWEPRIQFNIQQLIDKFPLVTVNLVRNSFLKKHHVFLYMLRKTLEEPSVIAEIIEKATNNWVSRVDLQFAGAVCPKCKSCQGETVLVKEQISFNCNNCSNMSLGSLISFDYWWHHISMLPPRVNIFNVDICIRGGDHFAWNNFAVNELLIKEYMPYTSVPRTLVTPILIAPDGKKMSKSRNNIVDCELSFLLEAARYCNSLELPWPI